ncbi:hypothetical protein [Roseospirillum parvum]|uniref:Uncharacterized protein n=1 Tax=Roseospirillum parvum TaxID=83401 RepID=A0A1G8D5P5_9PROT|nr:hypothetical protein [Roseospirillum parvum]SDH53097.1 hypothetical protein SAMN05421742_107191 [Roseospirillum parvum]
MRTLTKILALMVLVALVAGGVFLATWEMPAPATPTEEVIPHARFTDR